jgi:D-psicose/D-tagatose/L-ribulose 3-epimerase
MNQLAISNIAWDLHEEDQVLKVLHSFEVNKIEIAPTKLWSLPIDSEDPVIEGYKHQQHQKGFEIVAMQSLLFNKPELCLFTNELSREATFHYLCNMIRIANRVGAKNLVFGSPKNRIMGDLDKNNCLDTAIDFFYRLGVFAEENSVMFCIEPNPPQYGCDFITNTLEGVELVREVGHPGFRLHLDAAAMILNEESYSDSIESAMPFMAHFHISAPFLGIVSSEVNHHIEIAKALKSNGYKGCRSIEMKNGLLDRNVDSVERALDFASRTYL